MTIRSEIESRLIAYARAKSIPVAVENVEFVKPTSGPWFEVFMLTDYRMNRDVAASGIRQTGLFQVNCYAPRGTGMKLVESLAEDVISLYPVLPKTGTVSIEAPLNASSGFNVDAFICVPVTGRYRAEF